MPPVLTFEPIAPSPGPLEELAERVWSWSTRNLLWCAGDDGETLGWLDAALPRLSFSVQQSGLELNATSMDATELQRAEALVGLSLLALQPSLDALAAGYGVHLVVPATSSGEPLTNALRTRSVVVAPNAPGEPPVPLRVACVFTLDEWPDDAGPELDPRLQHLPCWIHTEQPNHRSILETLPETEIPGADFKPLFARLSRASFHMAGPLLGYALGTIRGDTVMPTDIGAHSSASRAEVEAAFVAQGFTVISAAEVRARQGTWAEGRRRALKARPHLLDDRVATAARDRALEVCATRFGRGRDFFVVQGTEGRVFAGLRHPTERFVEVLDVGTGELLEGVPSRSLTDVEAFRRWVDAIAAGSR